MAKNVCDFCLSEGGTFFSRLSRLSDGHHICKNCKTIITSYGLPVQFDLFQQLVTAQPNLRDMIMDAYLENHEPQSTIAKFYPLPKVMLHEGEHCLNACPASITVEESAVPEKDAVKTIEGIRREDINNLSDAINKKTSKTIKGILYETEIALYFLSDKFINCHRLGFVKRNTHDNSHVVVVTKKNTFTYTIEHADLFFLRERFFRKVNAAACNKKQHLIYIRNDNELTITPGVYEIPRSLRPGIYKKMKNASIFPTAAFWNVPVNTNYSGLETRNPINKSFLNVKTLFLYLKKKEGFLLLTALLPAKIQSHCLIQITECLLKMLLEIQKHKSLQY